jgi:hypothetical protein
MRGGDGDEGAPLPGHRNYLVFCDESGTGGGVYYGFGSLWMPWERRGDFAGLVADLRDKHRYLDEMKWTNVSRRSEAFYLALIEEFFRRTWLMFHCLVVRKGYVNKKLHDDDFDVARRKHFAMLLKSKIRFFSARATDKAYHVRVDPLPSRYKKADEAAQKIVAATLMKELGVAPLKTLFTRDSKATPGIQVADLLLGAIMSAWQDEATADPKLVVRRAIATHLGWDDLKADILELFARLLAPELAGVLRELERAIRARADREPLGDARQNDNLVGAQRVEHAVEDGARTANRDGPLGLRDLFFEEILLGFRHVRSVSPRDGDKGGFQFRKPARRTGHGGFAICIKPLGAAK